MKEIVEILCSLTRWTLRLYPEVVVMKCCCTVHARPGRPVVFDYIRGYQQVQFLFYLNQNIVRSHGFLLEGSGNVTGSVEPGSAFKEIRVQVRNVTERVQNSTLENMYIE